MQEALFWNDAFLCACAGGVHGVRGGLLECLAAGCGLGGLVLGLLERACAGHVKMHVEEVPGRLSW